MLRTIGLAAAATVLFMQGAAASITKPIPPAAATSPAVDLFQLSAYYDSQTGSQPFAAAPFELEAYVPAQVTYYDPAGTSAFPGSFALTVSGDYINDGVTTPFSNQTLIFVGAPARADFLASDFLKADDRLNIDAFIQGTLFSATPAAGNGYQTATLTPGSFTISTNKSSSASYNADPGIIGGSGSIVPVPEPGSAALLLTGSLGLAFLLGRSRRPV